MINPQIAVNWLGRAGAVAGLALNGVLASGLALVGGYGALFWLYGLAAAGYVLAVLLLRRGRSGYGLVPGALLGILGAVYALFQGGGLDMVLLQAGAAMLTTLPLAFRLGGRYGGGA